VKRLFQIFLITLAFSSCDKFKGKQFVDHLTPYETPPRAPIPPQDYCYEGKQGNNEVTSLHLIVTGDSITGNMNQINGSKDQINGTVRGVMFGNTALIAFRNLNDQTGKPEEQEWKINGDTIYKVKKVIAQSDSTGILGVDSGNLTIELTLIKASCK